VVRLVALLLDAAVSFVVVRRALELVLVAIVARVREADDDDDRGEDHEPEPRPVAVEERPCAQAGRWRCRRRSVSGAREGAESCTGCRQSPQRQSSPLSC